MKKILISVFLSFFIFTSVFWNYTPSENDKKTILQAENILKNFSEEKRLEIKNKIPKILEKLDKNSKNYFLISEIYKIILKIENEINFSEKYEVFAVIDGDSFHFKRWNEIVKARLIWIDAPESNTTRFWYVEPFWVEATEKLRSLIWNNKISIEYDETQEKTDKYWRELVYIFVNWKNIWEEMIKLWLAKEYTYNKKYKYFENFKKAEIEAKNNKLNIWSKENNSTKIIIENTFWKIKWNVNNRKQKIYHLPICKDYEKVIIVPEEWDMIFETEEEARKAWFRIAWNC